MPTILKSVDATVTATPTADKPGAFEAVVAVFGNTDSQNDVIDKGAFTATLADWVAKNQPIPVIYSHDWEDPFSHIGAADPKLAQETDEGLLIKGQMDLGNSKAAQVHKLMKDGLVTQFSFAATTGDGPDAWSLDGDGVQHLKQLNLIEVGPTLRGANTETHLVAIKSDRPTLKNSSPVVTRKADDADPDDTLAGIAAALDAAVDQALVLLTSIDSSTLPPVVQQGIALLGAADAVSDQLLALLNIADPDDDAAYPVGKSGLLDALVQKQGRVLAQKHVDALSEAHQILGDVISAASKSSRPDGDEGEPEKSANGPESTPNAAAKTMARLMELSPRKGAHS